MGAMCKDIFCYNKCGKESRYVYKQKFCIALNIIW